MKVIDLLNMMSKKEELPKKIKWSGVRFYLKDKIKYYDYENDIGCSLFRHDTEFYSALDMLNDEVEVLEEDKPMLVWDEEGKVVEVNAHPNLTYKFSADGLTITSVEEPKEIEELVYSSWSSYSEDLQEVYNKVNELIKAVNELKKGK